MAVAPHILYGWILLASLLDGLLTQAWVSRGMCLSEELNPLMRYALASDSFLQVKMLSTTVGGMLLLAAGAARTLAALSTVYAAVIAWHFYGWARLM